MSLIQSALPSGPSQAEHLTINALEHWLWDAACAIRGATDATKFKDFTLPLVFYKTLCDVFGDEATIGDTFRRRRSRPGRC